jgi:prepilin-type N-terminal cleavage/methylation domain-containing protein
MVLWQDRPDGPVRLKIKRRTLVRDCKGQAGFTLIELIIVVTILGILTAILIPNFVRARSSSKLATCQLDLRNIAAGLELYYVENQSYPTTGGWDTTLIAGGYMRAVPRSPIDQASYGYATNAGQYSFVLSDGPNKYTQSGVTGYVVYTATGGLQIGVPTVPSP